MSDKDEFPFQIPSSIGKLTGSAVGSVAGWTASGYVFGSQTTQTSIITTEDQQRMIETNEMTAEEALQEQLNSENNINTTMAEIGLTGAGAILGGISGYNLGAKNPNKSVLIGMGSIVSAYGIQHLHDKIDNIESQINNNSESNAIDESSQGIDINNTNIDIT